METDPKFLARRLEGLGTNLKLLWDMVYPEAKAFDPENLLIFSTGLF